MTRLRPLGARPISVALALALAGGGVVALSTVAQAIPAGGKLLYGLTSTDQLLPIRTVTGAGAPIAITGLDLGDDLVGIDVRPATGVLYGVAQGTLPGTDSLYTITPAGAASKVADLSVDLVGTNIAIDFNPTVDRIRIITDTQNLRTNPADGATLTDTALDPAADVTGAAYQNSFAGASTTVLYDISTANNALSIQNPPNAGTLTAVAELTNGVLAAGQQVGFDIDGADNQGFAVVTVDGVRNLFTVSQPSTVTLTDALTKVDAAGILTTVEDITVATPRVGFASATATVNENAGSATLTLTRVGDTAEEQVVGYTLASGTATAGSDFTGTSGSATFTAGSSTATVTVPVSTDLLVEGDETFTVTLTDVSNDNYTLITPSTATVTIVDQTTALSVVDSAVTEGQSGTVTVSRTGDLSGISAVAYATSDGTATSADYTTSGGVLVFPAGIATATFQLPTTSDAVAEGAETVIVTLSNANGAQLADPTGTITITDVPPSIISIDPEVSVDEDAGPATIAVTRTPSDLAATVEYSVTAGTAGTDDYVDEVGTVTFAPGDASENITIDITNDGEVEVPEDFTVTLSDPSAFDGLGEDTVSTVTIVSEDVSIVSASADVQLNEGDADTVTVTRTNTDLATTVDYATSDGSATAGADYASATGTLSFAAGQASAEIPVSALTDALVEGNETFTITLSDPGALTEIDDATTVVTIVSADTSLISVDAAQTVGEADGSTTVTVTRTNPNAATSVQYATASGTATSGLDFGSASGTINFAAGVATAEVEIDINSDTLVEGDEAFTLTLSNPGAGAGIGNGTSTITIDDDDAADTVSVPVAPQDVSETTATATVTVTRSNTAGLTTVDYDTVNGTAVAGQDYTAASGTLTFLPGVATQQITVSILNDTLVETAEAFTVELSNVTGLNTEIDNDTATINLLSEDANSVVSVPAAASVNEAAGTASITVTRTAGVAAGGVSYATSDGTATAPGDYTATTGTLSFAVGEVTKTITVPIVNDALIEDPEAFTVTLSAPTGVNSSLGNAASVVTITSEDAASVIAAPEALTVNEATGVASVVVARTSTVAAATVGYATANGTAIAGTDYTATSGTLSFAIGEATKTITVPVTNDALVEPNKAFTVALSGVTGNNTTLGNATTTVTIASEDAKAVTALSLLATQGVRAPGLATLRGVLTANGVPLANQQVAILYRFADGSIPVSLARIVTTDANGAYTTQIKPSRNLFWQAVYNGDDQRAAAGSPERRTLVGLSAARASGPTTITRGQVSTFNGYIQPGSTLPKVQLQYRAANGVWTNLTAPVQVAANGTFTISRRYANPGTFTLRIVGLRSLQNEPSVSGLITLRVL